MWPPALLANRDLSTHLDRDILKRRNDFSGPNLSFHTPWSGNGRIADQSDAVSVVRRDIADSLDTDTSNLAEERQHTTPGSSPGRATGTFCRHATHGTKKSRVTAPHSTLHFRGGGLRCSLSSPMFFVFVDGRRAFLNGFEVRWGYFRPCAFYTPKNTPRAMSLG